MRVALFIPNLEGGGAERVTVNLANGFASRGMSCDVVAASANGVLADELCRSVRVIDLGASRVVRSVIPLARYLHRERPRVLISALDYANACALVAAKLSFAGTKVVVAVHISRSMASANASGFKDWVLRAMIRHGYPLAEGIVAVSAGAADDLAVHAGIDRRRIAVIYNPIVGGALWEKAAESVSDPFVGEGVPLVLGMGRLARQKDFPNLVSAFSTLRRKRVAKLLILGEGEERKAIEALIARLGLGSEVGLPGYVKNPYPYLKKAAVFALSSAWEALPTVLIEALALGTPIVSTDCPCGPREILGSGAWGRLVPPGNAAKLAEALEAAIEQPPRPAPKAAWERFEICRGVKTYVDLLEGMCGA
ncbi:MAG: glycosyltransferase [Deltaproteobacteria bacterium]|nr:glycosyltransferase [Deltaproteobacteria bacterium]